MCNCQGDAYGAGRVRSRRRGGRARGSPRLCETESRPQHPGGGPALAHLPGAPVLDVALDHADGRDHRLASGDSACHLLLCRQGSWAAGCVLVGAGSRALMGWMTRGVTCLTWFYLTVSLSGCRSVTVR